MLSQIQSVSAVLAVGPALAAAAGFNGLATCSSDTPLSCQNNTAVDDLCCFNYPGGQLLLTQFWDTDPVTGPSDSWTIHGLWYVCSLFSSAPFAALVAVHY